MRFPRRFVKRRAALAGKICRRTANGWRHPLFGPGLPSRFAALHGKTVSSKPERPFYKIPAAWKGFRLPETCF